MNIYNGIIIYACFLCLCDTCWTMMMINEDKVVLINTNSPLPLTLCCSAGLGCGRGARDPHQGRGASEATQQQQQRGARREQKSLHLPPHTSCVIDSALQVCTQGEIERERESVCMCVCSMVLKKIYHYYGTASFPATSLLPYYFSDSGPIVSVVHF